MSRGASQYGMASDVGGDWRVQAACRGEDPAKWEIQGDRLSQENREALDICAACPVREPCRDDMRAFTAATSIIAGGWSWSSTGRPKPARGDEHLLRPAERRRAAVSHGGHRSGLDKAAVERFVAVGWARVGRGLSVAAVGAEFGLDRAAVYRAARVLREVPHLVAPLLAGEISIYRAELLAGEAYQHRRAMDAWSAA